jgi:hypothetical protein
MTNPDQNTEPGGEELSDKRPGRSWTERFTGSVRYRRFTDTDPAGRPRIFFKFELAPGQTELPQGVYDVLHEMKYMARNLDFPNGGGKYPTGLQFNRSKKHGRVYALPDNHTGRTAADIIDARLRELAATLDGEQGAAR